MRSGVGPDAEQTSSTNSNLPGAGGNRRDPFGSAPFIATERL